MPASYCAADAMDALLAGLGNRARMLDHLPFDQVVFQEQYEIPLAIPKAILFGTMKRKGHTAQKPLVWVYLCKDSPSLVFHTYYPSGRPDGILIHDEVISKATPNEAFQFATDPMRLLVLATYYFMNDGVETTYDLTMSKAYETVLESICEDFLHAKDDLDTVAKCSKVVKLRIRVPPDLLPNETVNCAKDTGCDGRLTNDDSGIDDIGRDSSATTMKRSVAHARAHTQPEAPMSQNMPIDRYLQLEDEEICIQKEVAGFDGRINNLKRKLESLMEEIRYEEAAVEALVARKDSGESERKRLWDTMSKEDIRKLGRRDAEKKQ